MSEKLELLTDNPLKIESTEEKYYQLDGLKFKEYTEVLTEAIKYTKTPFTIGIYGEWGKGKTSFLEMIKYQIDKEKPDEKKYLTVWFNAWKYEKDNDPIVSLLTVINETLENDKAFLEKLGEDAKDIIKTTSTYLKHTILTSLNIKMKFGGKDANVTNTIDLNKAYLQAKAELEKENNKDILNELINDNSYIKVFEYLKALEEIILEKNIHVVIFIDDMDRCMPQNAISLLESIKLILDLKGFTFVMGIANDVIEGHLKHRYENDFGIKDGHHGKSYLEKIIQLPFTLPKFSQKVENLVDNLFAKTDNSENIENVKEVINAVSSHSKITPRQLVRIINQAKIHAKIDQKLNEDNNEDMFALFAFTLLFENLYENEYKILTVQTQKELSKILIEYDEEAINKLKDKSNEVSKDSVEFVLLLLLNEKNKPLQTLFKTSTAKKWLKNEEIRNQTSEFIDKVTNVDEKEIEEQDAKKLENQNLEQIREYLFILENKITDNKSFNKLILNISDDKEHFKDFVKLSDEDGTKYELSKFLVTNKWYDESNLDRKRYSKEFEHPFKPVVGITYNNALDFCNWLNNKNDGFKYSLPTIEQLRYIEHKRSQSKNFLMNIKLNNTILNYNQTSIVGSFKDGNYFDGIFDLNGNASSLVQKIEYDEEDYDEYYYFGESWHDSNTENHDEEPNLEYDDVGFFITRNKLK